MANEYQYNPMGIVEDEKEAEDYKRQLANMGTGDEKEYLILFKAYVNVLFIVVVTLYSSSRFW